MKYFSTPGIIRDDINSKEYLPQQSHFANPVYESMYSGTADGNMTIGDSVGSHNSAPEEKKGLLQHNQDELCTQDLL